MTLERYNEIDGAFDNLPYDDDDAYDKLVKSLGKEYDEYHALDVEVDNYVIGKIFLDGIEQNLKLAPIFGFNADKVTKLINDKEVLRFMYSLWLHGGLNHKYYPGREKWVNEYFKQKQEGSDDTGN